MRRAILILLLVLAALPSVAVAQSKQVGDRNHITKDDLAAGPQGLLSAYDIIRTMRPNWFTPSRGRTASANVLGGGGGAMNPMANSSASNENGSGAVGANIIVYIDDVRQPSIDELRNLKASLVVDLRLLEQVRAVLIHGPGHELGAIEVTTVNKRK